jgi:hypothetical protein
MLSFMLYLDAATMRGVSSQSNLPWVRDGADLRRSAGQGGCAQQVECALS